MSSDDSLSAKLRRTADSVGVRGGHLVPLSYGSAAGELAICMSGVGLIDREDLRVLSVRAEATAIDRITGAHFARRLQPGQAVTSATVHWARTAAEEAILVSPAGPAVLLQEELQRESDGGSVRVEELPLTAIGIVGPATPGLLMDLGAYGALAGVNGTGTVAVTALGATSATWLLLDEAWAIALVEEDRALAAWELICAAGRRFGLGYVGAEAAARYELVRCQNGEPALG